MSRRRAVLDANVLFGGLTRDTLLLLAAPPFGLYMPIWSATILDELERNLHRRSPLGPREVALRMDAVRRAFPDAVVDPPHQLVQSMANHLKDRHVLAAAVAGEATHLVTNNLRHFAGADRLNIAVQSPDEFLCDLYDGSADVVRRAAEIVAERVGAGTTLYDLAERLGQIRLSGFADRLRADT